MRAISRPSSLGWVFIRTDKQWIWQNWSLAANDTIAAGLKRYICLHLVRRIFGTQLYTRFKFPKLGIKTENLPSSIETPFGECMLGRSKWCENPFSLFSISWRNTLLNPWCNSAKLNFCPPCISIGNLSIMQLLLYSLNLNISNYGIFCERIFHFTIRCHFKEQARKAGIH